MFGRSFALGAMAVILGIGLPFMAMAAAAPERKPDRQQVMSGKAQADARSFLGAAEDLYEAVLEGDPSSVLRHVQLTEQRLRSLSMEEIASAEGIEALARSVARMKRAVANVKGNMAEWSDTAAEIRLAADALAHTDAPLWHRYREIMREDVRLIEQAAVAESNRKEAQQQLVRLKRHYELIRTAILLHAQPFEIERSDSVLRYAERVLSADPLNRDLLGGMISSLREAMEGLFPPPGDAKTTYIEPLPSPPMPWGWTALLGVFIVSVLSWAGWLRYRHIDPVSSPEILLQRRHGRR